MSESELADVPVIQSEVTYLEMIENPRVAAAELGKFSMRRVENLTVVDYLNIYREVGRDYLWNYRPGQSESEVADILNSSTTWIYLLFDCDQTVGMAELDAAESTDVELVHFGLIPRLLHQGIGRRFLQSIVALVWQSGVQRMWLSTCGMDHPKAISFYEAAGFRRFKTKSGEFKDWRFTGFYEMNDAPQIPHGVRPTGRT